MGTDPEESVRQIKEVLNEVLPHLDDPQEHWFRECLVTLRDIALAVDMPGLDVEEILGKVLHRG